MAAVMAITPFLERSLQTNPILLILVSRSSLLKPRPFERWVRTTSPSRISILLNPLLRSSPSNFRDKVLFPEQESPVNQIVNPFFSISNSFPNDSRHLNSFYHFSRD